MKDQVCLITGGTAGIGRATALGLDELGCPVVIVGSDPTRGEKARTEIISKSGNENIEFLPADLSSFDEVRRLASEFQARYNQLDILINNVGVFYSRCEFSTDGIEMQFAINHLSHFLLTDLLLSMLRESAPARIVNVSSNAHFSGQINFDDINLEKRYNGWRAYCQSKLANVLFTYELTDRIDPKLITVNALHPGTVRTGIVGKHASFIYRLGWNLPKPMMLSAEEGAKTSIYLASSDEVEGMTGLYFVKCKPQKSSDLSYDKALASKLWDLSEELTGFKYEQNQ